MNKKELIELINEIIMEEVVEIVKCKSNAKPEPIKKEIKQMSDEEIEDFIFRGGEKKQAPYEPPKKNQQTLIENNAKIPPVTTSEINTFRKEFEEQIPNGSVYFKKYDGPGQSGTIIDFPKNVHGLEVVTSGVIDFGRNRKINFVFSLQNGLSISTENLEIDGETRDIQGTLSSLYTKFEQYWRNRISPSYKKEIEPQIGAPSPDNMMADVGNQELAQAEAGEV